MIVVEPEPRTAATVFEDLSGGAVRAIRHEHRTSDGRSRNQHAERDPLAVERDHGKPAIGAGFPVEDGIGAALQILDAQLDAARSGGEVRDTLPSRDTVK